MAGALCGHYLKELLGTRTVDFRVWRAQQLAGEGRGGHQRRHQMADVGEMLERGVTVVSFAKIASSVMGM